MKSEEDIKFERDLLDLCDVDQSKEPIFLKIECSMTARPSITVEYLLGSEKEVTEKGFHKTEEKK